MHVIEEKIQFLKSVGDELLYSALTYISA